LSSNVISLPSPAVEIRNGDPFAGLPLLLAVPEAARLLGISRAAAYRLTASGELPSRRLGGRVYVITTALRALVEAA
jgi:excisionase family DNA binding protein